MVDEVQYANMTPYKDVNLLILVDEVLFSTSTVERSRRTRSYFIVVDMRDLGKIGIQTEINLQHDMIRRMISIRCTTNKGSTVLLRILRRR